MDPPNQSYLDGMSGVGQLLLESEKTKRKLHKVQQRRDHYAKLYFQTLAQLEQVRAELAQAMNTIKELRGREQNGSVNSTGHHVPHSNTTTPDSGTSLSPGVDFADGRGQVEGRDLREGPQNFLWSLDSYRSSTSNYWSPQLRRHHDTQLRQRSNIETHHLRHKEQHPPRHFDFQPPQHTEDKFSHHHINPQQTSSRRHRNPSYPKSLPVKDDAHVPSHPAFSPTRPHFPMSPLQRRPPINPAPTAPSSHTLPHNASGKPLFQRSMTLPHRFPPPSLKIYSSGALSDDDDDSCDNDEDTSEHSKVSAFKRVPKASTKEVVQERKGPSASSETSSKPSSSQALEGQTSDSAVTKQQLQQHRKVSFDHTLCSYDQLSKAEFMNLLTEIGSSDCVIQKLEVKNSRLGDPQLMTLFCTNLAHNSSITELSLPENGIGKEPLTLLLDTVKTRTQMRDLKLRGNNIGQECAPLIKNFLTTTTLDSLVLTGNDIEQYGHLMDGQVPSEFSMEYSTDGSEDSGVQTASLSTGEPSPLPHHLGTSFKYLRI